MCAYCGEGVSGAKYRGGSGGCARHALLVGFQDAGDALEAVCEGVGLFGLSRDVCDCQTCCSLVQYELSRVDDLCELLQQRLNGAGVRYQIVDYLRPRLVQALVPDARREELDRVLEALGCLSNVVGALVEHGLSQSRLHQVHLVYQTKDLCAGTAFVQCADDVRVGHDVSGELSGLNIEDEYKNGDGAEDVVARLREVVFDKAVLTVARQSTAPACL